MRGRLSLAIAAVLVWPAVTLAQQSASLADVARREAERRKTVTVPGKVYTNADVKKNAPPPPPPPAPAALSGDPGVTSKTPDLTAPGAGKASAEATKPVTPKADAEESRDEEWYRKQVTEMRATLSRSQLAVEAFQSRANALWADFTARDDPAQRAVIEKNRHEALAELERLKREVGKLEQAIADFEEDARKNGVPPGWLR